jgi:nitroreductase
MSPSDFHSFFRSRRSIRAFRPDPVPMETIAHILEVARYTPSGTNQQPWKVHVVMGETRDRLVDAVMAHRETDPHDTAAEFPRAGERKDPYLTRTRTLGKAMYGLIGIPKGDKAANWRQWGRNYLFFDAPVGLIFTIDKALDRMSYFDFGGFALAVMLAARTHGLDTCAQGAWNNYWSVTRRVLNVPEQDFIICGMALGYADHDHVVNSLESDREPLESFATFHP